MTMRDAILAGVVLAALAACAPARSDTSETASVRGCQAVATAPWRANGAEFAVEARSSGPDCQRAVATLTIRHSDGRALWTDALITEHVMTLRDARDERSMQLALSEWVTANEMMATSATLPEWPQDASSPRSGEFPFYPEPHLDRLGYEELRAGNAPLFCYVQGMESLACVALDGDRMDKIGVQSFPG